MAFRCTCSKKGTAALWPRASPAVKTSRGTGPSALGCLVGQVLYLEAEEAGIRSTGIGCYFDDPVHEVFGISSRDWQSFYHFTVGGPVEDRRLTTLPPYNLEEAR